MIQFSRDLDTGRKLIVEYWADGPSSELPPGHWGLFAQFVSQRDHHTIDQDAKMFFAMHNASFDAGIVAWHIKRKYNGVRPITANEAGLSRLFGGIHFEDDNTTAQNVGYLIGVQAWAKALTFFDGSP